MPCCMSRGGTWPRGPGGPGGSLRPLSPALTPSNTTADPHCRLCRLSSWRQEPSAFRALGHEPDTSSLKVSSCDYRVGPARTTRVTTSMTVTASASGSRSCPVLPAHHHEPFTHLQREGRSAPFSRQGNRGPSELAKGHPLITGEGLAANAASSGGWAPSKASRDTRQRVLRESKRLKAPPALLWGLGAVPGSSPDGFRAAPLCPVDTASPRGTWRGARVLGAGGGARSWLGFRGGGLLRSSILVWGSQAPAVGPEGIGDRRHPQSSQLWRNKAARGEHVFNPASLRLQRGPGGASPGSCPGPGPAPRLPSPPPCQAAATLSSRLETFLRCQLAGKLPASRG